jgi:hypothetical protein
MLAALVAGCRNDGSVQQTLDLDVLDHRSHVHRDNIVIAITDPQEGVFDTAEWALIKHRAPWSPMARALQDKLDRDVVFRLLKPFQIAYYFQNGLCDFALTSEDEYVEISEEGVESAVVALAEPYRRQGLLVTRSDSDIQSLEDVRNKRFAFGPRTDPILFYKTLEVLDEAGISPSDLKHETVLTGFDGALQNHRTSKLAAYELIYGGNAAAAVVEASEFEAYPDTGGRWLPIGYTFSKDQFRILGRTGVSQSVTIHRARWIAAPHVDNETMVNVRMYLVGAHVVNPPVLHALGFARFSAPTGPVVARTLDSQNQVKRNH